jgi:integrase
VLISTPPSGCDVRLYPIVAIACFTGARRGEILALRWTDLDANAKTLRIERAIEETKAYGRVLKEPKTPRGRRTIHIDDVMCLSCCSPNASDTCA